ncbi:MAG: CvpA family protein [Rhodospirillales bacterium]
MASFPFTLIDVTLIAVVLISAILAFGRGFVHEALSIAGWIGAAAAVIFGLPVVRPYVRDVIQPPLLADFAAGASIFILAMIVLSIITRAIASRVHGSKLSAIDRSLGFVFGLVRGAVLICLAFIPVQWLMTPQEQPTWIREARLRPAVEWGAAQLSSLVDRGPSGVSGAGTNSRAQERKALETERIVRDMISPEPKAPETRVEHEPKGYDERERREIDRLLEGNR